MKFLFRPLIASAVKHYGFAKRLAAGVKYGKVRAKRSLFDGYIFLAQRVLKDSVIVKVIDPPARWLIPGWNGFSQPTAVPLIAEITGLDRGMLVPVNSWTLDTPSDITASTARKWNLNKVTFFQASFGSGIYYATCRADWRGKYAIIPTLITDVEGSNQESSLGYNPDMEFRVVAPVVSWVNSLTGLFASMVGGVLPDSQMSFGLSETGARAAFGQPNFRYVQNPERWKEGRTVCMGIPEVVTVGESSYDRYTMLATCDVQVGNNIDSGFVVGRFQAPRVVTEGSFRVATGMWANLQVLSINTDTDLRPQVDTSTSAYRRNTIYDLGLLETSDKVIVVASCMLSWIDGSSQAWRTTATQVYTFDRATGAASVVLENKQIVEDPITEPRRANHCLNQFHYSLSGVERTGLAAVRFDATDEIDTGTVNLVFYDETGAATVTGLRAAGYVPFWPKLHGDYEGWSFAEDLGYYVAPQPSVVREISPGRLGVVAASTAQVAAGGIVDWKLVIMDADTLGVLEERGIIATVPDSTVIGAYFTVVQQEVLDEEGTVVTPAILTGMQNDSTGYTHKLSRDGGQTWVTVFNNANWPLVYMGNGLHPVDLV